MRAFAEELKVDAANSTIIAPISARSYAVSFGEAIAYKAARQRRRPHDAYDGSTTVDRTYEKEYHNCYDEVRRSPKCWLSG